MLAWHLKLSTIVLQSWETPNLLSYLLWPLSLLYRLAFALRRIAYKLNLLKSYRAPVPVIVVGNITVGGTGKTPMVIYLIEHLRAHGYKPGVISRGYSGKAKSYPLYVDADTPVHESGDEPALIVGRTSVPLCVDANRQSAIELLLKQADVDVIISDDGLQHLALQRDIELCLLDQTRKQSNYFLLPAGPYREAVSRLQNVDFVIRHEQTNGDSAVFNKDDKNSPNDFVMSLEPQKPLAVTNLAQKHNSAGLESELDINKEIHAVAGIGNPQRFFKSCESLGLSIEKHAFDDHHQFTVSDISFDDDKAVLMTEKDAVKCLKFATDKHWYLPVNAKLEEQFIAELLSALNN